MRTINFMFITALVLINLTVGQSEAKDLNMPKTIEFMGKKYSQKSNQVSGKDAALIEYIPESETFENWTSMFAINYQRAPKIKANDFLMKVAILNGEKFKQGDRYAGTKVLSSNDPKIMYLDMVSSVTSVPSLPHAIEHNIWETHELKNGLLTYQFMERHYGKSKFDPSNMVAVKAFSKNFDAVSAAFSNCRVKYPKPQIAD